MTSNELATMSGNLPAAPGDNLTGDAVATLMQHAKAMSAAYELASSLCKTDMVPAIYKGKAENGTAAILYGAELGLTPIQSLQQIFTVHNTPSVYARTMVALVMARGHEVWEIESTPQSVTVCGRRRGSDVVTQSTWTYERARTAGYTSNKKYDTDPQAMLYAKAASEVCRKMAPDVLLGIAYSKEELELEPIQAKSERVAAPSRGVAGVRAKLGVDQAVTQEQPEQAPAEQAPADVSGGVEMCTRSQQQKLAILLKEEGFDDRADKLKYLEQNFGRPFASSAELTKVEASQFIDFLENAQAGEQG